MAKKSKIIIISVIVILLIPLIFYSRGINAPFVQSGENKHFIVKKGEGVEQIGNNLYKAGLIRSRFYFKVYVWQKKQQSNFQAGEYTLSTMLNIKDIVKMLTAGEVIADSVRVKIQEGLTVSDIDKRLKESDLVLNDNFLSLAGSETGSWRLGINKPDFLDDAPRSASLEGYLFPDTYAFFKDADAEDIISKMLNNFDLKMTRDLREDISAQGKTIYEIITMASIVQKEANINETGQGGNKEARIISGIFWNRLNIGQALQSDATLSYILGDKNPRHTREETEIDSPYNTYKYAGLPPGPILNPGIEAIKAAVYPINTEYNYFLNRLDTGEAIFSKTYEEHLENKWKYLK